MKIWVFVLIGFIVMSGVIVFALSINHYSGATSVNVVTNITYYVRENESCKGYDFDLPCKEGLECVLISTEPYENGICMKNGTILEEDFINRNDYITD